MAKVFIFAPADRDGTTHRRLEDQGCELVLGDASWHSPRGNNEPEMIRMAAQADALMGTSIRSSPITRDIMLASDKLRIVAKYTIGVDDVEVDVATEMGIMVTHSPTEANWGGVAEGMIASMLAFLKKIRERDVNLKTHGVWRAETLQGTYLGSRADGYAGIVLGIVGLGRIGSRVSDLLRPWKMRILAYDPYVPEAKFAEHGIERAASLDEVLTQADVVTLHCNLTQETYHLMGEAQFARMKASALFVNMARGHIMDEPALARALDAGQIAGAVIDVFEDEPLPDGSPLRGMGDKVLLSSHMVASNRGGGIHQGITWAAESVLLALQGKVPDCVYNPEVLPAWNERFGGRDVLHR